MLARIIHCWLLIWLISLPVAAQQLNYPVTEENGQKYYLYTVEPREGLYAVSHKFNVTQADILNCNPSIADGLKTGQVIKIPLSTQSLPAVTGTRQHTVLKKQTLYSIAYQYGVSVADIVVANPQAANGIKEGDVLRIPPPKQKDTTESAPQKESKPTAAPVSKVEAGTTVPHPVSPGTRHKVVAGETFYSLSRLYNIPVDAIKNANPAVDVLKTDETVIIPSAGDNAEAKPAPVTKKTPTPLTPLSKNLLRVAILLPFSLDGVNDDPTIEKFVDFYRGTLIALSDIKEKGISVDVHTYDIEKTVEGVSKILQKEELTHVDLIIGPAYAAQTKPVAEFAKTHKIYTVIPFTQKVEGLATNPYLFQCNPSAGSQYVRAAGLFAKQFRNHNIIIAQPANGTGDEGVLFANNLTNKLKQMHIPFHTVTLQEGNLAPIKPWLNDSKPAIVVLGTSNAETAAPYLSAFASLNSENKHVPLYGFLDWEPETNVYPNLYYSSLFYTHNKANLSEYNRQYTQWFHLNPNSGEVIRFDLLGYDIAFYFLSLMSSYGIPAFTQQLTKQMPETIDSRFAFRRVSISGGYQNNELHLLNYKSDTGVTLIGE